MVVTFYSLIDRLFLLLYRTVGLRLLVILGPFIIIDFNALWCLCVSLQCRWGSEALCDLQHCSGLWLCRALQPVWLTEGAGAALPADIPRPAQRLPQRQACLPCPCTDALALQIKREWEERWLSSIFFYSFY